MYSLIILLMFIALVNIFKKKTKYLYKLIYINILQSSAILFYIYTGSNIILQKKQIDILGLSKFFDFITYSSPITNVLMLTAIVVGFAISALGFVITLKLFYR
ncbi:MAG: NADH-quinone oxidoreductase subunit K [Rickettsiales bacterium]